MTGDTEERPGGIDKRASSRMSGDEGAATPEVPADEAEGVEDLKAKLAEATKRAEGYLASWQRAAADYQNLKKRVEKERDDYGRLAAAAMVINFLPILDDLERALESNDVHLAGLTWVDGVRLIYRKFQAAMEAAGVAEIKADGETFDPNLHEAVMYGEGEEGKVVSVVQKGYLLGDRVLRPAMVVVGKGTEEQGTGNKEQAAGNEGPEPEAGETGDTSTG